MEKYKNYTISDTKNLKSPTIYFFLKQNGISEHVIKALRQHQNAILLNNEAANLKTKIQNGDVVSIHKEPSSPNFVEECDGELEILYEDDDYLVLNKPHNLACIPTRSHFSNNLGGQIMRYMHRTNPNFVLRIVNRLDKDTAGIVIIAKNVFAYNNIGKIDKTYHALCEGNLQEQSFTISKPILTEQENGVNKLKRVISPQGKQAITHVELVKNYRNYCHIRCRLETGRTHQIRVHLASINHPLLCDSIYSNNRTGPHTFLLLKEVLFKEKSFSIPFPQDWSDFIK